MPRGTCRSVCFAQDGREAKAKGNGQCRDPSPFGSGLVDGFEESGLLGGDEEGEALAEDVQGLAAGGLEGLGSGGLGMRVMLEGCGVGEQVGHLGWGV